MSEDSRDYWKEHGFTQGLGDPVGLSAIIPATGLVKALLERQELLRAGVTWEAIRDLEVVGTLAREIDYLKPSKITMTDPALFARWFDGELAWTAQDHYINHLAKEVKYWTWEDLCQAMTEQGRYELVKPRDMMVPHLSWLWAHQRYIGVNLLRRLKMQLEVEADGIEGSQHNGIPSSPPEALARALAPNAVYMCKKSFFGDWRTDIYGPTHGWRQGSYCINIDFTTGIRPILPEGVQCTEVILDVKPYLTFDDMGTGLVLGLQKIKLSEQGRIDWPLPTKIPSLLHPLPVLDVNVPYGWTAECLLYTEPEFHFFHNCDYVGG